MIPTKNAIRIAMAGNSGIGITSRSADTDPIIKKMVMMVIPITDSFFISS